MKVNLARYKATQLTINLNAELNDDVIQRLRELTGAEDSGFTLSSWYRIGNGHCRVDVHGHQLRERPKSFHFFFIYHIRLRSARRTQHESPDLQKVVELFQILAALEDEQSFGCQAVFNYEDGKDRSVIQLPWKPFQGIGMPFNEIVGLHLQQRRGEEVDYSIVVDGSRDSLQHSISFSGRVKLSMELPGELLRKSHTISSKFLTRE